jgi:hypothetical protein
MAFEQKTIMLLVAGFWLPDREAYASERCWILKGFPFNIPVKDGIFDQHPR